VLLPAIGGDQENLSAGYNEMYQAQRLHPAELGMNRHLGDHNGQVCWMMKLKRMSHLTERRQEKHEVYVVPESTYMSTSIDCNGLPSTEMRCFMHAYSDFCRPNSRPNTDATATHHQDI